MGPRCSFPRRRDARMTRTFLVVDDSRLARMSVTRLLADARPGWTVIEAANAEEALAAAAQARIDGAVIDYNMPGLNGLELAAKLRTLNPRTTIALVTANFQTDIVARAAAIPALFLPKPLRPQSFDLFLSGIDAPAA